MKQKIVSVVRAITISASLLLCSSTAFGAEYVSVIKDGVNVRTGPGTSNPVYMEVFSGYPLQVLEKKGDWLKIQDFEKDTGWVFASLVKSGNTVIVKAKSKANMRSGPGTSNGIVANLERGVVLDVLEKKQKWVKVRHVSGTQGWIYAPLLWP